MTFEEAVQFVTEEMGREKDRHGTHCSTWYAYHGSLENTIMDIIRDDSGAVIMNVWETRGISPDWSQRSKILHLSPSRKLLSEICRVMMR